MAAQTNPKIRGALLKKLGVSPQRLYQLAAARKRELPMSTAQAIYTIAHENGVDVAKHLSPEETREIQGLVGTLPRTRAVQASSGPSAGGAPAKKVVRKETKVTIANIDVGTIPGLKASHATDAKRMAEKVYPALYLFENSVRDLIEAVLKAKHGDDWWDQVAKGIQTTATKNKAAGEKDPWHGPRSGRPIDYVYLAELWQIIEGHWKDFSPLFPTKGWVETIITRDMNVSRRALAHMTPLAADDISAIEVAFRKWVRQLQGVADKIP